MSLRTYIHPEGGGILMHQEKCIQIYKFPNFITVKEQSPVLMQYMKSFSAATKFLLGLGPYSLWCEMKYEVNLICLLLISYLTSGKQP